MFSKTKSFQIVNEIVNLIVVFNHQKMSFIFNVITIH